MYNKSIQTLTINYKERLATETWMEMHIINKSPNKILNKKCLEIKTVIYS